MAKTRFWDETPQKQSSKRLIQLVLTAFAIIITTVYLVVTWDYAGAIALFMAVMTIVTSMMGIGKKQENDRIKLERNGTGS